MSSVIVCKECGGRIITDSAENYCERCGLTVIDKEDNMLQSAVSEPNDAWNTVTNKLSYAGGMGSVIGRSSERKYRRLRTVDMRIAHRDGGRRMKAYRILDSYCVELNCLNYDVKELTKNHIMKSFKMCKGVNLEIRVASCLYLSFRLRSYPVSLNEMSDKLSLDKGKISETFLEISKKLGVNYTDKNERGVYGIHFTEPLVFVDKYCNSLKISKESTKIIRETVISISKVMNIQRPDVLVAAVIYVVSTDNDIDLTRAMISEITSVPESTLNTWISKVRKWEKTVATDNANDL